MSVARPTIPKIQSAARKSQRAYEAVARPGEKLISDRQTDCQVLVGRDNCPEAVGESPAFVAFRGTTSVADWSINGRLWLVPSTLGGGAMVHGGFAQSWQSVKGRVFEELAWLAPTRITVVGHSLGGANAMIASTDIITQFPGVPVEVITFGAPRCGNVAYGEAVAKNVALCTRVVHDNDVVPSLPSVAFGYTHCNTEWLHIRKEGDVEWKPPQDGWWSEMWSRWSRLVSRELGVDDHRIERYIDGCEQ